MTAGRSAGDITEARPRRPRGALQTGLMTPVTVTRWNGSYPGETRAAITSNAIRATAGPRLVMAQSIETGHHGAGRPAVCSPAGAEEPGNLVQGLAQLGQALRRETGSRERVAADPVDHGFQEVFPRYGQAPCVQLGQVDLADLVPGPASGPGSRGLECLFAGARAAPGLRSHLAEVGEFDAVFVEAAPFLLGARAGARLPPRLGPHGHPLP